MTNFTDVGKFHEKFNLHNTTYHDVGPTTTSESLMQFRAKFMDEELLEFLEGMTEGDIAKMADALVDLVYVAMGTAHLLGLPWEALWNEVQRANMEKRRAAADGSDSKRDSAFDVVKPEGWRPPNIAAVLNKNGWDLIDPELPTGC